MTIIPSKKSNRSWFLSIGLLLIAFLSGLNFLNQFKISSISLFLLVMLIVTMGVYFFRKRLYIPLGAPKYYLYYVLASLIPLLIGVIFNIQAFFTFIYTLLPLVLFILTYKNIDYKFYNKFLLTIFISMLLITLVGWLIRLGIVEFNFFFEKAPESEFLIGYWGIRYLESSRNADYLYPMLGMAISIYFFIKNKNPIHIVFIFIFLLSLLASLSRTALIISFIALIILFLFSEKKVKLYTLFFLLVIIIYNYEFIYGMFNSEYSSIISSIFSLESTENRFSNTARLKILEYALSSSLFNPFGYGIDNYGSIYNIWDINDRISYSAENAYLTILVEKGWFSFFFFLLFWLLILKKAFQIKTITLNKILVPVLTIYFLFNYELNNIFANFIIYILLIDYYLQSTKRNYL